MQFQNSSGVERVALTLLAVASLVAPQVILAQPWEAQTRYLIQYHAGKAGELKELIARTGGRVVLDYSLIDGLAADLSRNGVQVVRRSGLARTIEEDAIRTLHAHLPDFSTEFVPWGVDRTEADAVWSTEPNGGDPNVLPGAVAGQGIVVGILDTGIDYGHPDLASNIADDRGSGVVRDFIDLDDDPSDTTDGHGTSVGSVVASVDNQIGVIGVAPLAKVRPYRVCDDGCPLSAIIGGLVQAVIDGVDVINMSFGGPAGFNIEASAVQAANAAGIVLVAASGNEATQQPSFPAAYDTVLAVGATDINDNPADFTNVGGWVDVTGPGVAVPAATCLGCGRDPFLDEVSPNPQSFQSNAIAGTAVGGVAGTEIVDVGRACVASEGDTLQTDPSGKVALVVRGTCSFAEKVQSVEAAGGLGTVIFNNVPGSFFGTLGDFSSAGPAVSVSQSDGQTLQEQIRSAVTSVDLSVVATDYSLVDGTSFSAPHVAAIAALVKSVNPALSPIQVRKIIESTAEPLGRKVVFGNGMVRADLAVGRAQN